MRGFAVSARRSVAAVAALAAASAIGAGGIGVAPLAEASVARPAPGPATIAYTVIYIGTLDASIPDVAPDADPTTTTSTDAPQQSLPAPDLSGATLGDGAQAAQTDLVCALATIDLATGVETVLPATPSPEACAGDLAFAPDGTLYGLLGGEANREPISELVRFDTATGAATVVGQIGTFSSIGGFGEAPQGGITFDRLGRLFVEVAADDGVGFDAQCSPGGVFTFCLYHIADPGQPQNATLVGPTISNEYVSGLASSCDATYLEHTSNQAQSAVIGTLDIGSGSATEIGTVSPDYITGLDFDASGKFWAIHTAGQGPTLDTINPAGGDPINATGVPIIQAPEDDFIPEALAIEPLRCVISAPITFTG